MRSWPGPGCPPLGVSDMSILFADRVAKLEARQKKTEEKLDALAVHAGNIVTTAKVAANSLERRVDTNTETMARLMDRMEYWEHEGIPLAKADEKAARVDAGNAAVLDAMKALRAEVDANAAMIKALTNDGGRFEGRIGEAHNAIVGLNVQIANLQKRVAVSLTDSSTARRVSQGMAARLAEAEREQREESQKRFDAYSARARAAHLDSGWSHGVWEHQGSGRMKVIPCDWISDSLYGEVYWLGITDDGVMALSVDVDATLGWALVDSLDVDNSRPAVAPPPSVTQDSEAVKVELASVAERMGQLGTKELERVRLRWMVAVMDRLDAINAGLNDAASPCGTLDRTLLE